MQRAQLNGIKYKVSDILLVACDENAAFAQIVKLSVAPGNRLLLYMRTLLTEYRPSKGLFAVVEENEDFFCFADDLTFPWPALQYSSSNLLVLPIAIGNLLHIPKLPIEPLDPAPAAGIHRYYFHFLSYSVVLYIYCLIYCYLIM
jgi:hypothetical protein